MPAPRVVTVLLAVALSTCGGAAIGYWFGARTSTFAAGPLRQESDREGRAMPHAQSPRASLADEGGPHSKEPPRTEAILRSAETSARRHELQLAAQVDAALVLPGAHERDRALTATIEDLAAANPQAALLKARGLDASAAEKLVPIVIGSWAESDLEAATDAAFLLESARLRMAAAREILRRRFDLTTEARRRIAGRLAEPESIEWLLLESQTMPAAAAAVPALIEAAGMAGQSRRHDRLDRIAQLLALQSPAAALALADDLTDPRDRVAFHSSVVLVWAQSDPPAAARWLDSQSARQPWTIVTAVAGPYARSDPQAALDWARRTDPQGVRGAWSAVIATLAETDPVTAAELALAADIGRGPRSAKSIAMAFLARKDPALATQYLDRLTAGSERSQAAAQIAIEMARQGDPVRALDWLATQGPAAAGQGRMQIAMNWVQNDPDAALRFADRLSSAERTDWQRAVVNALVNVDPDSAMEVLQARRGDANYSDLVATAARTFALREPELAIALAGDLSESRLRDDVFGRAIPQVARTDPREAVRLLERIEDDAHRIAATQGVAQIWAQHDADAALDWVRSMPSGPARDQGFAALVPSMTSARTMESAIERIQQDQVRRQAVFNAAVTLAQRGSEDEARALVFRHPLEPAMMQALESRLREGTPPSR